MQSFIVLDKNKDKRLNFCLDFCRRQEIKEIDILLFDQEESFGIEQVRTLQKKLFYKPFKSKMKALVIVNADNLTLEAQNAFLKVLEEPSSDTIIILAAKSLELFLPTVISRCKIINLRETKEEPQAKTAPGAINLERLLSGGIGYKLRFAQDVTKNKEETIDFLEKAILAARQKIIDKKSHGAWEKESVLDYIALITSLQEALKTVKTTNAGTRLLIENLLLSTDKQSSS